MIKEVKIVVSYEDGAQAVIDFKGPLTYTKVNTLLNQLKTILVNEVKKEGGAETASSRPAPDCVETSMSIPTEIYSRIKNIVKSYFKRGYFTSHQVKEVYEEIYNEEVKLNTVSTYLSRLYNEGGLKRVRHGKRWVYQLIVSETLRFKG